MIVEIEFLRGTQNTAGLIESGYRAGDVKVFNEHIGYVCNEAGRLLVVFENLPALFNQFAALHSALHR